jgi:prolyl oligopeptidase
MRRLLSIVWIFALVSLLDVTLISAQTPPIAPVRNVIDEHWGVKVSDPYRYMEDLADSEVKAWIKGQAEYTEAVLDRIPGRDELFQRIRELDAGSPYRVSGIRRMPDGELFHFKQAAEENLAKVYRRDKLDGDEHLLIDPETMEVPDGGHYSISFIRPSPDGRYLIYGIAASGSEETTLRVLDVSTGQNLPDSIDRLEPYYTPPQWLPDGDGFYYCRLRQLPAEAPPTEGYKRSQSFLHRLGGPVEDDQVVFAMDLWPGVAMTEDDFPSIVLPSGSDYAIGQIKHGDANQLTLYAAPHASLATSDTPWKLVCDVPDSVTGFAVHGEWIYMVTSRDAPRSRIVRAPLASPSYATAEEVIPAGRIVLRNLYPAKDALYVSALDAGMSKILRVDYATGEAKSLDFPDGATSAFMVTASSNVDGIMVQTTSWTKRGRTYAYDPATDSFADTGLNPQGAYDDVPGYESVEVEVSSHDGVMIPLSIVYKSGLKLDGSNPTLLDGYGAYGFSRFVYFDPVRLAWLERGGILAISHVRGGGEFGPEWHLGGQKLTKPNTWKDFIACGEYLVEKGYTSPAKLSGSGGSAGGILIGRAITERPDLFGAAIISVGDLDAVRMETTTNGVPNIQEFGTVTIEEEFHALLEMSSYHQVKDGEKYPAVILVHGINDPRVEPWMSAKMCARLQAATASDKPVVFRVDYHAGHGIGSTKEQYQKLLADEWAFFWQLGNADFQP